MTKYYKGFNKDMTCRGFQYKEGETYTEAEAALCKSGFHACEDPLECFGYYAPAGSVYHEVEMEDISPERNEKDTKVCAKTIKIGAKLDMAKICELHFEYVNSKCKLTNRKHVKGNYSSASAQGNRSSASVQGDCSSASAQGNRSSASVQGDRSSASAQGYRSSASVQGDRSSASAQGDFSSASVQGDCSSASAQGNRSSASVQGDRSSASAQGYFSSASAQGYFSSASAQGYRSSASVQGNYSSASAQGANNGSVALALGYLCQAKADLGNAICICERGAWNGKTYPLLAIKAAIVDGVTLKPDTWYKLEKGEFVEAKD